MFWNSTIYPKRSALSAYSPLEEQAQTLLLTATSTHFWSSTLYTTFHREAMLMLGFFLSPHTPYGRVRLARTSRLRLLRHALPISLLILRKKPIVLHSTGKNIFLTFSRRKTYNTVKHQYYAVKSQYHLVQSPISGSNNLESTVKKKKLRNR